MNIIEIIKKILLNNSLLGALFSTLFITALGYVLRKKNKVKSETAKQLTIILLSIVLPALSFNAFMTDFKSEEFIQGIWVFIFSIIFYISMIFLTKILYANQEDEKKLTMRMITIFGSTTFFGIPVINAVYGNLGTILASIFNITYRLFLYSYCLISMSSNSKKDKLEFKNLFKTIFANPIIIATLMGLIFWIFQDKVPKVNFYFYENNEIKIKMVSILRIDQYIPWVAKGISTLASLSSPLAWLAIGMTLAEIKFKDAIKENLVWIYSIYKLILTPLIYLMILLMLNSILITIRETPLTESAFGAILIFLATPPATVAVSYAINFNRSPILASNCSVISTFFSIFSITIWVIIITILTNFEIIPK